MADLYDRVTVQTTHEYGNYTAQIHAQFNDSRPIYCLLYCNGNNVKEIQLV